jgi:hypothetical protein
MENNKSVIEEYKVQIENSPSSIFTREDVVGLLTKLEVSLQGVSSDVSGDLQIRILDRIEEVISDEKIEDNIELDLQGFEISCSYDIDDLIRSLSSMVREEFEVNKE